MNEKSSEALRDLFFQTGLPEAYCLARRAQRREAEESGEARAAHHPGDRPAGDQL